MLRHKNIDRVCCIVLALTLLISALFMGAAANGSIAEDRSMGYETRLFDQSRVHTIDIVMNNWEAFLDTATGEEYSACHLVIDGESFKNVGIRGKGNTSLSSVASYGNDRYSFKIEFDQYQTGNSYYGLDKLSLNNLIYDNTYLKDYLSYTLMGMMGVASPLCSFVQVNVNGEYWGLYLAVEGVEEGFLQRSYGKDYGELYKPDSMSFGGGRGNGGGFDMNEIAERFGFSFGGNEEGENDFTLPDMSAMPSAPADFDLSDRMGSSGGHSSQSASTPEPTATATPEPTATPTAAPDMGRSGGSSDESSGDAASSGMPAGGDMPADDAADGASGGMPAGGEVPAMPTAGAVPEGFDPKQRMGSSGESAGANASVQPQGTASAAPATTDRPAIPGGDRSDMPSSQMPEGFEMRNRGDFGGGGVGGGLSMGSDDVKLVYSDDDPSSYSNIFNNAKTDITQADQKRLIASIKAMNEGDTSVINTDAVIRYMAVHNFLCNEDSYTGTIVHNYYLYEKDGVLEMIPWDYNLAMGGQSFGGSGGATSLVNTSIDSLVTGGSDSDRPMAGWITASGEYTAEYHTIYDEFIATVFESGWFAEEFDRIVAMISPYVETDPTAFCTYEEFQNAAETLKEFCLRRARSVRNQLDGSDAQVDASDLDLSVMGGMGGGMGGFGGGWSERGGSGDMTGGFAHTEMPAMPANGMNFTMPTGEVPAMPTDEAAAPVPTGTAEDASSGGQSAPGATPVPQTTAQSSGAPSASAQPADASAQSNPAEWVRPGGVGDFTMPGMTRSQDSSTGWYWIAACAALLLAALAFAGCYRNNR